MSFISFRPRKQAAHFAWAFVALALVSGITIGMNKVLVTLMALRLEASSWQIGLLIGAESFSMMLMSLPAGALISRYGARRVYGLASLGAMVLYPLVAHAANWYMAAGFLFLAGICIPYRVVAMNSSWLERLPEVGASRAGWYRGTLMLGIGLLGPLSGNLTADLFGVRGSYWITSALFAAMAAYGYGILAAARPHPHPEPEAGHASPPRGNGLGSMLAQLRNPVIREVCTFDGLAGIVRGFFGTFVVVVAVRVFHWSEPEAVMVMVVEGAMYVAVLLLIGPLALRLGEGRVFDLGHVCLLLGLAVLGLTRNGSWLFVGALLHALGQGFNQLVNIARIARVPGDKGHVSGLQTMVGMGGSFLGAAVGGLLSRGFALQDVFLLWIPVWLAVCPPVWRLLGRVLGKIAPGRRHAGAPVPASPGSDSSAP